jgi:class 3 adenylate cyclase
MDPAEVVVQLNEYFDKMVAAIAENGGVVDKFVGDAVMAVFGGVIEIDNPCESAVRAALSMRKNLSEINEKRNARGLPSFQTGIGIEFGMVLQGTIGSADRKEFTVVGDAVNTASRIEGITKEYDFPILISANVHVLLPDHLKARCESVGAAKVKGKQREIDLYGVR